MKENDKSPRQGFRSATRRLSQLGTVLHPTSKYKRWWDLGLALCVLYNGIFCPLHVAFDLDISAAHQIMYSTVDLVFIVDVFMNFNTGFIDKNNVLVMDHATIAQRYIHTWFAVDVISSVPVELLYSDEGMEKAGVMRLNKMVRLIKLAKMFSVIRLGRIHRVFNRWEILPQLRYAVMDISLHVLMCVMWAHWFACAFFFCAKIDGLQEHAWFKQAKQQKLWNGDLIEEPYTEYILSLYHAVMVMFTIDMNFKPENNRERLLTMTAGCSGAVLVLYSLSTCVMIVQETIGLQTKSFRKRVDHLNDFIRRKSIPDNLASDLIRYYEHLRNRDHFSNELGDNLLLQELPAGLKDNVLYSMHPKLMHGDLLNGASRNLAVAVLKVLTSRHFSPLEIIMEKNAPAKALYFLVHGEIETWDFDGEDEPATISCGECVGQASLSRLELGGAPPKSPVNAASLTYCEVFVLSRAAAAGLLISLKPAERAEWLRLTARHGDGINNDAEAGVEGGGVDAGIMFGDNLLMTKLAQLREKESELISLRDEVYSLISSTARS
mmetsp:Transcript_27826/g.68432  ORF Transcript_27826/g.68432 Transcript_27826/m.68432 type:complete len:550 (-) Transcript_27826:197-1846(-)|eukprot:CAMPEP_0197575128 /NCGR_PEP_ID=MMETSP1326-20131121/629_1 /TAXON_ID=1155430 /ORGANISM="Genus nov. species nov., Strain RCC2288" /LENGTH=549 /DNA_ID=CAMNT_0043137837 /DNA_START=397 /DNA_END=2046 /DNA_ORIENTATION=+